VHEFLYARPETLEEAMAVMAGGDARALAGGTDLLPQMRQGRVRAAAIVDLKRLGELTSIFTSHDGVTIGAAASAAAVARNTAIAACYPAVSLSARLIGSIQIRNRASLGGNICNAAPSADAVPALICHGARARIAGECGSREVDLEGLFRAPGRLDLDARELLVAILLPVPPPSSAAHYLRFTPRREMDIAIAGAGAWLRLDEGGTIAAARIVLAAVAPTPMRAGSAEQRLMGERPKPALFKEAGRLAAAEARPISDTRGSADYRRHLVAVLTARALAGCAGRIAGGPCACC
jgi:carbon-monoxide dehydrogenase medium subunit